MLRKLQTLKKRAEGFTIIEVLIVLAIAALILVIVLVAIPQLQRNQRNTARTAVASRIATEISAYAGNNNGALPLAVATSGDTNFGAPDVAAGFSARYLGCNGQAAPNTSCTTNINNPSTGAPYSAAGYVVTAPATLSTAFGDPNTNNQIAYLVGYVCSGENPTTTGAGGRNFALIMPLEGGARTCLDNN